MKTINKLFAIVTISLFIMSCSSDDDDTTQETQNVFEKLQGNTYRQIETPDSCNDCEDEINYYSFSRQREVVETIVQQKSHRSFAGTTSILDTTTSA